MALGATSPTLDAGISAGNSTDQRLVPRPTDLPAIPNAPLGNGSDIGAFEALDDDDDGIPNEADSCPALDGGGDVSGCPAVPRELTLRYRKGKKLFKGSVLAETTPECIAGGEVTVLRKQPGDDKEMGTVTSETDGAYKLFKRAKKGRYQSTVEDEVVPGTAHCQAASSPTIRVRK
jgi:hypothetical protein